MPSGAARIYIYGLEELNAKLDDIKHNVEPELRQTTEKAVHYAHSQIPAYPAPPSLSTYRRTGTLGREFTTEVKKIGADIVGVLGTAVVYAPYVVSDKKLSDGRGPQAWMHKGRWYTLQQVVRDAHREIINIYKEAVATLRRNWK